jgi:hypothetical protein
VHVTWEFHRSSTRDRRCRRIDDVKIDVRIFRQRIEENRRLRARLWENTEQPDRTLVAAELVFAGSSRREVDIHAHLRNAHVLTRAEDRAPISNRRPVMVEPVRCVVE